MKASQVLEAAEYRNYRNIRTISVLFVLVGGLFALAGTAVAIAGPDADDQPRVVFVIMAIVGATGVVGGIATWRGNPKWAPLAYVMASMYLFAFPVGTILSYIMLTRLSKYLKSAKRLREARAGAPPTK